MALFGKYGVLVTLLFSAYSVAALDSGNLESIQLPEPELDKAGTVMQALKNRSSTRSMDANRSFSLNELSNIIWAVDGVNRPDGAKRVSPTGFSRLAKQASVIFVMLADGVYLHDPEAHTLTPILQGDYREDFANQDFAIAAPLNIIYALDLDIIDAPGSRRTFEERFGWGNIEVGHKSMAGYLYCAVEGCTTVYRAGGATNDFVDMIQDDFPNLRFVGGQAFGYEEE